VRAQELVRIFEARESVRVSLALKFADVAQLVERLPSKQDVAGSNPVFRSTFAMHVISLRVSLEGTGILVDSRM
jgi:hypothetical protein